MIYFIYIAKDPEAEPWYFHVQMSRVEARQLEEFLEDYVARGLILEFAVTRPEQGAVSVAHFKRRFKEDLLPSAEKKRWIPFGEGQR